MLKISERNFKGNNYVGHDNFNNNSNQGLYVWLKFDNQEFEVNCYINDNHVLEQIILINDKTKVGGDMKGEYLYSLDMDIEPTIYYRDLIKDIIQALRQQKYIPEIINENYNIKFEDAKKMPIYKFGLDDVKSINELIEKINSKDFKDDKTIVAVLEFGNIDIEINVINDDIFKLEYFIYSKYISIGWESYDSSDTEVVLDNNLEKNMFNELMRFAKEHSLYWSTFND